MRVRDLILFYKLARARRSRFWDWVELIAWAVVAIVLIIRHHEAWLKWLTAGD